MLYEVITLADTAAQLLGKAHIRLQLRRFLGRKRWHVDRIGDPAVDEIVGNLLGHLERNIDLRFRGRSAEMRRADEVA